MPAVGAGRATSSGGPRGSRLRRALYATAGFTAVGLAWLGVFVPGLPTTIWLIMACWCFARSCPWLEERLVRTRLFAPFLRYMDPDVPLTRRSRLTAMAAMWTAISISSTVFALREPPVWPLVAVLIAAGIVGTVVIARVRRGPRAVAEPVAGERSADREAG